MALGRSVASSLLACASRECLYAAGRTRPPVGQKQRLKSLSSRFNSERAAG